MKRRLLSFVLVLVLSTVCLGNGATHDSVEAKVKYKLNKKKASIKVGKTVRLKVKGPGKKYKVKWSSNKKKIATVNKKGLVKGKKKGRAIIRARVNKKTLKVYHYRKE